LDGKRVLFVKRIHKELDNIFQYSITVVSAAMGYGKTTSVKTYLGSQQNIQVAWLSLLGSDEQEFLFWNKFIKAFKEIDL
jgi:LuxR family maltose regulon positive regulatory protein